MARTPAKNGKASKPMATTLLMPPSGVMEKLYKAKSDAKKQASSASGIFSDKFSKAQEEKHVDRRAANIAFGLAALDDKTLHITLYHLRFYLDDMGLDRRADQQSEMFEAGEVGPGPKNGKDHDDEDGDDTSSARRVGAAARAVAEQAGARLPSDG